MATSSASSSALAPKSSGNASGMESWALDPFNFNSVFDTVLRDPFGREFGRLLDPRTTSLPMPTLKVDVSETDTAFMVHADAPGFTKDQIKVEVDADNVLHIATEKRDEKKDAGEREGRKWHRVERSSAAAHRSIKLPANADVGHIAAKCDNGVLEVTIPKLASAATDRRRITIM